MKICQILSNYSPNSSYFFPKINSSNRFSYYCTFIAWYTNLVRFCIQLTFILFNLCLHPKQANITQTLILFPSQTEMRYLLIVIFIQLNQTEHNFALPACDGRCKQKITSVVKISIANKFTIWFSHRYDPHDDAIS